MRKLLLLMIFASNIINAQETEFTFDSNKGMTDFIVVPVEGKTAPEIYKKIIEWIKVTYKNPDKVILSTIENEYIRFEGSSETLYAVNITMLGKTYYNSKYQIEISIKDNKYKFDLIGMQNYYPKSQYSAGGWTDNIIFNTNTEKEGLSTFYKKSGDLKSMWKYLPEVPTYFNDLNKSMFDYIKNLTAKKNNDW
ncbi:DUF4468 domain-containing protein [Flavobacterium pectinovorum]|uniref:DUF4468 domain-containing protein n=1 Tax=Flavobacterium pectinovorum TaxID=29533 RepID=UPI00265E5AA2|nr:DUF4468 domain-containing protein [Flavobacterium pectinovorum]WKL47634.1 DUF4468 domain-containing protein [Flavobacterium pectinovorum]